MSDRSVAGIILAAGKGTRMKSDLPKVLHPVCGLPMVELVGRALKQAGVERPIVVIGHGGEKVQEALGDGYDYAWQREQLGTGHAAMMTRDLLAGKKGTVIVLSGDAPLVQAETIATLLEDHEKSGAVCTVATAIVDDPTGYGRIVRDAFGLPTHIVEEKDATPAQKEIKEVNTSFYCFEIEALLEVLPRLSNTNAQREYYLTDTLLHFVQQRRLINACVLKDKGLLVGVNDRWQLALADRELRHQILKKHALNGVTLLDPDSIVIGVDVKIGVDTVLSPSTYLLGNTEVGTNCQLGPCLRVENSKIGDNTTILMSQVVEAEIGSDVWCGPFANIRPATRLANGAKVGDFVEIKNSFVAEGAKVPHLSYIGDATIGARSNIGAGTITCNYDGFGKFPTVVGADVFVGSNSTLVAPVTIGDRAMTAAGSTITNDVPDDSMAFGRARQVTKEGMAADWRKTKRTNNNH